MKPQGRHKELALVIHGEIGSDAAADDLDTLEQIRSVSGALLRLGYDVETVTLGLDLDRSAREIANGAQSFVFNLVEQIGGRDALLPIAGYLLDHIEVPYTGAPSAALAATSHKPSAKRIMSAAGIPTPPWLGGPEGVELAPHDRSDPEIRWIVKSATEHASAGLCTAAVVHSSAVTERLRYSAGHHGGEWFAERYVEGREVNASLLADHGGPLVLPLAEIEFLDFPPGRPRIVDYEAKWAAQSEAYRNTPRRFIGDAEAQPMRELAALARRCWAVFGLRGYARVDFRIDPDGRPWVLEINANPCLSPDAGFAAAAAQAGISFDEMIGRIVQDAGVVLPEPSRARLG